MSAGVKYRSVSLAMTVALSLIAPKASVKPWRCAYIV
jgi:hypothetical protein